MSSIYLTNFDTNSYQLTEKISKENDLVDPSNTLLTKIMIKVFSLFPIKLLGTLALVSKNWKDISEEKTLWEEANVNIQNEIKRDTYNITHTCAWIRNKQFPQGLDVSQIKSKLNKHKKNLEKTEEILASRRDKWGISEPFCIGKFPFRKEGFISGLVLHRLGLCTFEQLKKLATSMLAQYSDGDAWETLAIECLSQGDIEEATDILEMIPKVFFSHFSVIGRVIQEYISKLSSEGKFVLESKRFKESFYFKNLEGSCLSSLTRFAREQKAFDFLEKLLDQFYITDNFKISTLLSFEIRAILYENEMAIFCKFVKKYRTFLDPFKDHCLYKIFEECLEVMEMQEQVDSKS